MLTGTRFSHLHIHSNICTSTGHRLVCCISGACLMAISKGRFCWRCKMADKVSRRSKRGESRPITFWHSVIFSFIMPLTTALQLDKISRLVPTGLFCDVFRRSLRRKHLPLTACWCLGISDDCVGNDDDNVDNDNDNNNNNTWLIYQENMKSRNYRKQPYWILHTYFRKY